MKCCYCHNELKNFEIDKILVTCDGDFVCDTECEAGYKKARDHFFDVVIQSEESLMNWFYNE